MVKPHDRQKTLIVVRNLKMARSAHAFVRGSTEKFYAGSSKSAEDRAAWRSELAKSSKSALDAPSGLWRSVVELVSLHEAAYLNHCRQYSLAQAA